MQLKIMQNHISIQLNYIYRVPVYSFAEDFVMNSAVYLATSGDKCFTSEYSVIGDFGFV